LTALKGKKLEDFKINRLQHCKVPGEADGREDKAVEVDLLHYAGLTDVLQGPRIGDGTFIK
jgi:hypothetical protein